MKVLGIDPGVARVGFGVVASDTRGRVQHIHSGLITTEPGVSFEKRLLEIETDLKKIIQKTQPDLLACEKLYFQNNAKTAFEVGQARGVILLSAAHANLPLAEFTPLQVKQAITGYGQADKAQIQSMVVNLLKLDFVPKPDDVADALAIALCGAFTQGKFYA